jgi:heme-degrading monooxygenase HmoA
MPWFQLPIPAGGNYSADSGTWTFSAPLAQQRTGLDNALMVAYVWEFYVLSQNRAQFEKEYGPNGSWIRLFRGASGYTETMLLRDISNPLRYVSIDRWDSATAYESFRSRYSSQYQDLDLLCEGFTTRENFLGQFSDLADRRAI